AKESPQHNRYAKYEGEPERRDERRKDRHGRPQRRLEAAAGRGPSPPPGSQRGGRPPSPRPEGGGRGRDRRPDGGRPAPLAPPLPEVQIALTPEDQGVDVLAKQIRITGRAYPLFEIAQIILQKPERHAVTFSVKKRADGTVIQALFLCALDDTLWLSEDDAVRYVLDRHFPTFYQPERTKIDPPKGVYTFVAQCGMSGVILGPPNYHDYQNQLRKLHTEKFPRMPFDAFKARVKIVKDEEVVKKWVEEQSWKTEYTCLNLPEALKLPNLEEVEKHFRQVHLANIIKPVETHRLSGAASRSLRDRNLLRLLRQQWEDQKRFPLQIATVLSQQFAARGLQFFKVNKTFTHVAVARPHYLDLEATPVSDGVRRIVEFINATPKCTHRQLLETLVPRPATPLPSSQDNATAAQVQGASSTPPLPADPTPEMAAVMTDLHWLIHQGHVIEFGNGILETAKKPFAKPTKPPKPAGPELPAAPVVETPPLAETETTPAPSGETAATSGVAPAVEADAPEGEGPVGTSSEPVPANDPPPSA
ncbi:MAG TPA: hypothetical protein VEO53_06145, partial [Candidatus Binatia bacterium]|nr:hypothetical protein [Candidatus Binatia bacterium]